MRAIQFQFNDKLHAEVKGLMQQQDIAGNALAKEIGISGATLSQWLSGSYPANPEQIEAKISAWLQRRREVSQLPLQGQEQFQKTAETTVYRHVTGTIRQCHLHRKIGMVTSQSGTGKTRAIKDYVQQNPGSIHIEGHPTFPARSVLQEIARQANIEARGNVHEVLMAICDRLKGTGRVIVIDEAEHLKPHVLDLIRRVYDFAGVGIVYVGLPRFASIMRGLRGDYQYIWNRTRIKREVVRSRREVVADLELLLKEMIEDAAQIAASIAEFCGGDIRQAEELFFRSYTAAMKQDVELTVKLVELAAEQLELKRGGN